MSDRNELHRLFPAHVERQQRRWEQSLNAESFDAAIVHAGSQIVAFLDDYHYPFRPNPHFLSWVPLTRHHESVLTVRPGDRPVLHYYQPDDYWYLPPADPEPWWADHFDVRPMRRPGQWKRDMPSGRVAFIGDAPELAEESHLNPSTLINRLHLQRTRKTQYEVACIGHANGIAACAHQEAARAFRQGCSEFEIHQRYLSVARHEDAQLPYANIVALNEHGAVLHYQQRERQAPHQSRSFLIDAGATVHAYCSDITRTHADGQDEFEELIQAMDALQQDVCGRVRAGVDFRKLHLDTHRKISGLLADADIVHADADDTVESGLSAVFFPHGLGHFIGLQTHDVAGLIADEQGTEIPRPEGHPFLRLTRMLEPGNVLTVEPGIYFIESLLDMWRREGDPSMVNWDRVNALSPCGGIRIEDNVVVTDGAPVNLTREAFRD